ncbi:MAG: GTPase-activating protein [Chrysothrix sp. TS-e1954]|nr:MAG: GTPase-activating protein [Chrysothrix sp. TS-e1954]
MCIRSIGNTSRPRTPPVLTNERATGSLTPPHASRSIRPSPQTRGYRSFLSETTSNWNTPSGGADGDDYDDLGFDDDEDEFGLPSIATASRLRSRREAQNSASYANGQLSQSQGDALGRTPGTALDSGDIAEERNAPQYPTATQTKGKILRPQYKDILRDPANSLHLINHPVLPSNASEAEAQEHGTRISRINKFKKILQASAVSSKDLRDSAWSGVPEEVRAMTWQLLLGYLPTSSDRRVATLERKRKEYIDGVRQAFERVGTKSKTIGKDGAITSPAGQKGRIRGLDEAIWHQISIDVPRTNPHLELYGYEATQRSLERILYVWAIRHPASGYVQGINDLVTPFWQVFLGSYITDSNIESGMDPGQLPKPVLDAVEADSFWCLTKLLDGIQDNYIHAQPGIHRQVSSLRDLTKRIDSGLVSHMEGEGVEFMQFSFRWMNCLLMREVSVKNVIRMWDTYLAEEQGFSVFHLYVCAAFLVKWSDQLVRMDFQEIMMFLQALPTREWTSKDVELLLSEAFIWQSLFRGSSAHLKDSRSGSTAG